MKATLQQRSCAPATGLGVEPLVAKRLAAYHRIGLEELGDASLMRRQDTKFVFRAGELPELIAGLEAEYRVLEVGGLAIHDYLTLYFDTAALDLFQAHHRGKGDRVKVRERQYLTTGQLFLEIKRRSNKGVTTKTRTQAAAWDDSIDSTRVADPSALMGAGARQLTTAGKLLPTLWNGYRRMTFVRIGHSERVTIDTNLSFSTGDGRLELDEVAIVEVKQERVDLTSPFMRKLRALGARPGGASKYCLGMSLLRPEIKHNRFKPRLRALQQLTLEGRHVA